MSRPISAWAARAAGIVIVLAWVCQVQANSLDWTYPAAETSTGFWEFAEASPGKHAAQATFTISDSQLKITLTNTYTGAFWEPTDALSGILFRLPSDVVMGPEKTALIGSGSSAYVVVKKTGVVTSVPVPGGDVSSEWAYRGDLDLFGLPFNHGISATGMDDLMGEDHIFTYTHDTGAPSVEGNLWDQDGPDGIQGAITGTIPSSGDDVNGGLKDQPLISHTVEFTLDLASTVPDLDDISDVWFHYGTEGIESPVGPLPPIPEPLTMLGVLVGIGGLTRYVRKRRTS